MINKNKVFIVLVSYNTRRFLDGCLNSLLAQDYTGINIVIVDNASPDDSNAYIEEHFPEVTLLKEPENFGFGKACNIGAKYALEHGADYVLFLNTDTEADANLVTELARYADPGTVTTCFTYNDKASLKSWYAGGRLNRQTLDSEQTLYPYNPSQGPVEVEFISGCCMMVHRDIFAKAGFFDESYFMYYEDAEWCARLRQNGIRLLYIQSTKLFHYEGGSQSRIPGFAVASYYGTRNKLELAAQHSELLDISYAEFFKRTISNTYYFSPRWRNKVSYEKKGMTDFLKSKNGILEPLCFEFKEGFWDEKYSADTVINHCVDSKANARIYNYSGKEIYGHLTFKILPVTRKTPGSVSISVDDKEPVLYTLPCMFDTIIRMPAHGSMPLDFMNSFEAYFGPDDIRSIYFTVADVHFTDAHGLVFAKSPSILWEETDGSTRWNWVTEKECEIAVWNCSGSGTWCRIKALLLPPPNSAAGTVDIYRDGLPYREGFSMPGQLEDVLYLEKGGHTSLSFRYKGELETVEGDNRTFAFAIRELAVCEETEGLRTGKQGIKACGVPKEVI